ncbi:MAG: hypothetical protein GIW98_02510 [Candidatus Eremiobacteraeota bacterium]|nr:hypothetical protein [Candidatus Eremiobacteraeota bacterium]
MTKRQGVSTLGAMELKEIVDCRRYIDGPKYESTVALCRRSIRDTGCAVLERFVREVALNDMLDEANAAAASAYRRDFMLTAYGPEEAVGDKRHPTRRTSPYRMSVSAGDRFAPERALSTLHRNPTFIQLIAEILGEKNLFPLSDPLLGLAVSYLTDGDEHGWHFDRNDFVVSLALQEPEHGGEFQYAPYVRSSQDPNFRAIERLMDGDISMLQSVRPQPGTLSLFCGKRALHRVSTVRGKKSRVMALLSYDREPNVLHDEETQLRAVGRTTARA